MEQQHFVTFVQYYMDIPTFITELYFDFNNPTELHIHRKEWQYHNCSEETNETISFPLYFSLTRTKEKTIAFLIDFFSHKNSLFGYPIFIKSDILTKDEFEETIKTGIFFLKERDEEIKKSGINHPIIQYCTEQNLYPEPEGSSPYNWQANCPSGRQHHFYISTHSNTWGCGYCKKKGTLEELEAWIKIIRNKKSSE